MRTAPDDIPYNAFFRERVERALPQVADIASRMGYTAG